VPVSSQQAVDSLSRTRPIAPTGRFAPSPTGDLHFGSLLAALASYCDIKQQGGKWLLRIDDIDAPRSTPGSPDAIQRSLEQFGFEWDGPVQWQSQHAERYHQALSALIELQLIFNCNCSRRSLPAGKPYPGLCRSKVVRFQAERSHYEAEDVAFRCRLNGCISFVDGVQGLQSIDLGNSVGDIIVWRRDGLVSYSLACAIDDADTSSHVVRGADLLESTSAQIAIMSALGMQPPSYAHIPVAVDNNGDKLSKHSKAQPITDLNPLPTLLQAWRFLGQDAIYAESLSEFWEQAIQAWNLPSVPDDSRRTL